MAGVIEIDGIPSADNVLKIMGRFSRQVPFATSVALNNLAGEIQKEEVSGIQKTFTLRKNWWKPRTAMGVNIQFSNKSKLETHIFTRAPFMVKQEYGGIKTPKGKHIAIPERKALNVADNKVIPQGKRPQQILTRPRTFIQTMPNSGKTGIWQRVTNKRLPIKLLYAFGTRARIRAVLGWRDKGMNVYTKKYQRIFGEALAYAIATSK